MNLINPFRGIHPGPGVEARILAPPYDVLTSKEAHQRVQGNSDSFLHVSRAEIDLPPNTDPYSPMVYEQAAKTFRDFQERRLLIQDEEPCFYIYRMAMDSHVQTGIVGSVSISAYNAGRVKKHENTQPRKLEDRIRHIQALRAQTGPVFMIYRPTHGTDAAIREQTQQAPLFEATADHGVVHTLWAVHQKNAVDTLRTEFEKLDCLYIADGHHRSEAAARVAAGNSKFAEGDRLLSVCFPDDQVHIWDYNRLVKDLGDYSPQEFLEALKPRFQVRALSSSERPRQPAEFSMYLDRTWFSLAFTGAVSEYDPVLRLDISILSQHLLKPFLGIHDQRNDPRIDFVGGRRGLEELQARVDSGEMQAAFAVRPPTLKDLMTVADAGKMMPTKSTWFEPKLADGLISLSLEA